MVYIYDAYYDVGLRKRRKREMRVKLVAGWSTEGVCVKTSSGGKLRYP